MVGPGGKYLWLYKYNIQNPYSDGSLLCPDCISVTILVVILCHSFCEVDPWKKLSLTVRELSESFLKTGCESMIISQ